MLEKQLAYEHEDLAPMLAPESFTEISPLRRIPVLQDDQVQPILYLPDSSAICLYLERCYPERSLYPTEPASFAKALWLEEYADTEFSNIIGQEVFRPVVVAALLGGASDTETAKHTLSQKLPRYFSYLESQVNKGGLFCGSEVTLADVSVAVHFQNLKHAGFSVDSSAFPKLSAFIEAMLARDSFGSLYIEEQALLKNAGFVAAELN